MQAGDISTFISDPDLIELGVNALTRMDIDQMLSAVELALSKKIKSVPHYGEDISDKICNILIGNSLNFIKILIAENYYIISPF